MSYLTIRNLQDSTHAALSRLAAANHRSVNAETIVAIEERVRIAKGSGPLQEDHNTHIELSSTRCYYAWCSALSCDWQSPYRKAEIEVKAFALKHEASAAHKSFRAERRASR